MSSQARESDKSIQKLDFTLRKPLFSYLHIKQLRLAAPSLLQKSTLPYTPLDEVTIRSNLASALQQYLGLTGAAIPIDILKVEPTLDEAWIRVPRNDENAFVAALSQWISASKDTSLKIVARGTWLGGLVTSPTADEKLWKLEK